MSHQSAETLELAPSSDLGNSGNSHEGTRNGRHPKSEGSGPLRSPTAVWTSIRSWRRPRWRPTSCSRLSDFPRRRRPPPRSDAVQAFRLTAEISRDFAGSFRSLPVRSLGRQWFGSRTLVRHHNRRCRNIPSEAKSLVLWFRERAERMESGSRYHDPAARRRSARWDRRSPLAESRA